jgi:exopolysaccharide production protein ExoZ
MIVYRYIEAPLNRYFRYRRPLTAAEIKAAEISVAGAATEPPAAGTAGR